MKTGKIVLLVAGLAGMTLVAGAFWGQKGAATGAPGSGPGAPGGNGFAVVELFTSEGCSSCPSADALVAAVQKEDKDLPVYILSFHVDYWDRMGWKDAFSDAAYSNRQREYAGWLKLSSVYTPQVVVNGRQEFVGSDAGMLRRTIGSSLQEAATAKLSLSGVGLSGSKLNWQAHAEGAGRAVSLLVAVVEHSAVTRVKAGENGGKTLAHVQIVRSFQTLRPDGKGNSSGHLEWPAGVNPQDGEVIAFLQDQDNGRIVAATRSAVGQ